MIKIVNKTDIIIIINIDIDILRIDINNLIAHYYTNAPVYK